MSPPKKRELDFRPEKRYISSMKKKSLVLLALAALLLLGSFPLFAQAKGALSILCNVTGARVYLNGELAGYTKPTFSALLKPGQYTVKVTMDRYRSFNTVIQMTANPLTLNVLLEPEGATQPVLTRFTLTVTTNVAGAQVYLNNTPVGVAPLSLQVERGSYSVRVSAAGYQDYLAAVSVNGTTAVNAVLQSSLLQLTVNCNLVGAQVYINNNLVGTTPHTGSYAPGGYAVRVVAPGYAEASTVVNLSRSETLTLILQPAFVSIQVNIPQAYLNPQQGNPLAQVKVLVDGQFYNSFSFNLPAGRHNIRISSGGLSFAADYEFAPGRSYVIEPVFNLTVR
jgi:hypothetical protein